MKLNYKRFANIYYGVWKISKTSVSIAWSSDVPCTRVEYSLDTGEIGWQHYASPVGTRGGNLTIDFTNPTVRNRTCTLAFKLSDEDELQYRTLSFRNEEAFVLNLIGRVFDDIRVGDLREFTYTNTTDKKVFMDVRLDSADGEILTQEVLESDNATFSIYFTPSMLYEHMKDVQSCPIYYKFYYILDDGSYQLTRTVNGNVYIKGDEYPVFRDTELAITTTSHYRLTKDYSTVINGYSNIIAQTLAAKSNYNATITGYSLVWGDVSTPIIEDTSGMPEFEIVGGTGTEVKLIAYDSRGLSTQEPATAILGNVRNAFVPYVDPLITKLVIERDGGVGSSVKLSAKGTFYNGKFGPNGVPNVISNPKYDVYDVETGKWLSETKQNIYITDNHSWDYNSSDGTWEIRDASIHANGVSGGFDPEKKYIIKLIIEDGLGLLGKAEATKEVLSGKVARDVFKDYDGNYHEGINGLANSTYTQNIHGTLNVKDGIYVNGELLGGSAIPGYSYDEVATGMTWVDGKPIYRKYIYLGNLPTNMVKGVDTGLTGVGTTVRMDGYMTNSSGSATMNLPYIMGDTTVMITHNKNSNKIIVTSTEDMSSYIGYVTIEYTKTTD